MNTNITNTTSYLRTSREFPTGDPRKLESELNKSYVDIALSVNSRTIGIFTINKSAITGDVYIVANNKKQQAIRQVYTFGAITAGTSLTIPYKISTFTQFSRIYGTCITATPDYRSLPYASVTANANIELNLDTNNINISVGAASPNVVSGMVIIEWLSQP